MAPFGQLLWNIGQLLCNIGQHFMLTIWSNCLKTFQLHLHVSVPKGWLAPIFHIHELWVLFLGATFLGRGNDKLPQSFPYDLPLWVTRQLFHEVDASPQMFVVFQALLDYLEDVLAREAWIWRQDDSCCHQFLQYWVTKSYSKVEWTGALYFCLYASSIYITQGGLELCHTRPAGFSSIYIIGQL